VAGPTATAIKVPVTTAPDGTVGSKKSHPYVTVAPPAGTVVSPDAGRLPNGVVGSIVVITC
jgi:hypothetical protein